MASGVWQQWAKHPEFEGTLVDRARGILPEMESTKQLVKLVSEVYESGMRVLDVGCNVGHYLRGLRRLDPGLCYTGVDATDFYIAQARDIYQDDPAAHFEVRNVFDPIFPDDPHDIVYCCNVILHLPDFRIPVRNLLNSTKEVCFIRTLFGNRTTIVKAVDEHHLDDEGNPENFVYQNTWQKDYFSDQVSRLGWRVEFIDDEFNSEVLKDEYSRLKKGKGTNILDGIQVRENIIFNWMWAKITPA